MSGRGRDVHDSRSRSRTRPSIKNATSNASEKRESENSPMLESAQIVHRKSQRSYLKDKARVTFFMKTIGQFLLTLIQCIGIILAIKTATAWKSQLGLSRTDNRLFGGVTTGLTLGLGLNLASSLKNYASLLRWTFLSRGWYNLDTFDLILSSSSLTKLTELIFKSWPWPRWGHLGAQPSAKICGLSIIWILFAFGTQVLVASLSLTWASEPSSRYTSYDDGTLSVADFSRWTMDRAIVLPSQEVGTQAAAAHDYGVESQNYNETEYGTNFSNGVLTRNVYNGSDFWAYTFLDSSPDEPFHELRRVSNREVRTTASCAELPTRDLVWCYFLNRTYACVEYSTDNFETVQYWALPNNTWSGGSVTYMGTLWESDDDSSCGPRCANMTVYQAATFNDTIIPKHTLLQCNSTIEEVKDINPTLSDFSGITNSTRGQIYMNNTVARLGAGAISFNGFQPAGDFDYTAVLYHVGSRFNPNTTITTWQMADLISRFSIGAIAASDDHGPRLELKNQHNVPRQASEVRVYWTRIWIIMGVIVGIQGSALIALLVLADIDLIRDDSYLSISRLLLPIVEKLPRENDSKCAKDIRESMELEGVEVAYGWRRKDDGVEVDILWKGHDRLMREGGPQA
ncbi:hypothetical protein M501DRAFT_1017885 [Patellaria atrata CBS 101060]|uniref:Uncharacterized protein n=1 Tax=Patellaria atrata CBS 101060 TaxID=1346257 RepID=A0A9P4VLG3_9PEZI|nr:hypothetical protein M501DRAFT_1017885 [Patellaria atrata CBS 101060]